MKLDRRDYQLGENQFGMTLQGSPSDFVRLEVYPEYFGLTWSTPWSTPNDYSRLAQHVLQDVSEKAPSRVLISRPDESQEEADGRQEVERALEGVESSAQQANFVRLDVETDQLEGLSLSWQAHLPSDRLRGAAIGFVGCRFSRKYVQKLLRKSATRAIQQATDAIVEELSTVIPTDLQADV